MDTHTWDIIVPLIQHRLSQSSFWLMVGTVFSFTWQLRNSIHCGIFGSHGRVWLPILLGFYLQILHQLHIQVCLLFLGMEIIVQFCPFNSSNLLGHELVSLIHLLFKPVKYTMVAMNIYSWLIYNAYIFRGACLSKSGPVCHWVWVSERLSECMSHFFYSPKIL